MLGSSTRWTLDGAMAHIPVCARRHRRLRAQPACQRARGPAAGGSVRWQYHVAMAHFCHSSNVQRHSSDAGTANHALSKHASGLEDQLRAHEVHMAALREECERLRALALGASAAPPAEVHIQTG